MTSRRRLLSRLSAVRAVRLCQTGRQLAEAGAAVAGIGLIAGRIADLRREMAVPQGSAAGYGVKAAAELRAALQLAEERQGSRLLDAERVRDMLAADVRQRIVALDAITRTIARLATDEARS